MGKSMCISGIVVAALVFVVFLSDLIASLTGFQSLAPFRGASLLIDIVFVACAVVLALLSWSTLKEQT